MHTMREQKCHMASDDPSFRFHLTIFYKQASFVGLICPVTYTELVGKETRFLLALVFKDKFVL